MGKKDILKVECSIEALDLDILGFIDHNITVNVIKDDKIVEKKILIRQNVSRMSSPVKILVVLPRSSRSLTRFSS